MRISVRRLGPRDAALACDVARVFKSASVSRERVAELLRDSSNYLLVAEVDSALAGFLLGYGLTRLHRAERQFFVYEVEVSQRHRQLGVGTRLLEAVRRIVDDEGMFEAFVITSHSNAPAVRLYRKTGARTEESDAMVMVYPARETEDRRRNRPQR